LGQEHFLIALEPQMWSHRPAMDRHHPHMGLRPDMGHRRWRHLTTQRHPIMHRRQTMRHPIMARLRVPMGRHYM